VYFRYNDWASHKAPPKQKEKMKTRNLLITIGAAALTAITFNAYSADALLSPRAAGNQIKHVSGTSNGATAVAATSLLSPRAAGNQLKTVPGTTSNVNPAIACAANMNGTPKAVAECSSHTTMPGCKPMAVATAK
jgi:hypothetical protein